MRLTRILPAYHHVVLIVLGLLAVVPSTGVWSSPARAADAAMSAVDRLVAIEEIKQLKARYFRCVAQKDWDCWRAVFASDFTDTGQKVGPDGMMERMHTNGLYDRINSVFAGHMPEIEILSPTTARGIWAADYAFYYPPGEPYETTGKEVVGVGKSSRTYTFYIETYVKRDGRWQIQSMDNGSKRLRTDDDGGISFPAAPPPK